MSPYSPSDLDIAVDPEHLIVAPGSIPPLTQPAPLHSNFDETTFLIQPSPSSYLSLSSNIATTDPYQSDFSTYTQQSFASSSDAQSDESNSSCSATPTRSSPEPETVKLEHCTGVIGGDLFYFCQTKGCKTPQKPWKQLCQLRRHQRSHSLPVRCKHCPKRVGQPKDLARHIKRHHCTLANPDVLNDPKVGKQFIKCHVCGQSGRYDNIKRHIKKKHPEASSSRRYGTPVELPP
jgi:hypothetical protein